MHMSVASEHTCIEKSCLGNLGYCYHQNFVVVTMSQSLAHVHFQGNPTEFVSALMLSRDGSLHHSWEERATYLI